MSTTVSGISFNETDNDGTIQGHERYERQVSVNDDDDKKKKAAAAAAASKKSSSTADETLTAANKSESDKASL